MIERVALIAVAAVCAAAGIVWLHSARLQDHAQTIAQRPAPSLSAAQVDHAVSMFQRARAYDPDTRPIVFEAGLLERRGLHRRAIALLRTVVAREPSNLTAWTLLAIAAQSTDPALARRAVARSVALNPLGAPGR